MAGEIMVIGGDTDGRKNLLFYYPIPAAIRKYEGGGSSGTLVVPTPSSNLPEIAVKQLPADKKAALDAGEAMFYVKSRVDFRGLTAPQALALAQAQYDGEAQHLKDEYEAEYTYYGQTFDAS